MIVEMIVEVVHRRDSGDRGDRGDRGRDRGIRGGTLHT